MEREINLQGLLRETDVNKPSFCSKCGCPVSYKGLGEYVCDNCGFHEFDDYGKVRLFLEKNPGANIVQIEARTGVSQKIINQLVSEGKFEVSKSAGLRGDKRL